MKAATTKTFEDFLVRQMFQQSIGVCFFSASLIAVEGGDFVDPQFGAGLGESYGVGSCVIRKPPPQRLCNASQYKVLFYLPPFCRNFTVKLWPLSPPRLEGA